MKLTFRILLIATAFCALAGIYAYFLERNNLPPELRSFLYSQSLSVDSEHRRILEIGYFVLLSAFLICFLGLFFFWRPARILYCALLAISLLVELALGPRVDPKWAGFWSECSTLLSGVIVGVLFTPSLRDYFAKKKIANESQA